MAKSVTRLFESFQPAHYDLSLTPDTKTMKFTGTVKITGQKVGRPSQRLTFHQHGLTITKATITHHDKQGATEIIPARINHQRKLYEVRLHAGQTLYPGQYTVSLEFKGDISRDMQGIYPSFFNHHGTEKVIITTQFESHHAREAFPCIDEPEAKATFDLTLTTPKGLAVIGNMPQQSQSDIGKGLVTTTFETTPKMSTYLLAFTFGELHSDEAKTKDGVIVRSWAAISRPKELLQYSVQEGVKILEFFTDYFDIPFPLTKCDQIALPDFDAGAMENWGMVTYREVVLLADPQNRSISSEQLVTLVIAHELSHQWFGNLVTMKWWDDLWLNESFAALMEHLAPDSIHPDWHQWELYSSTDILSTTSRDIYNDIQPISVKVTDPDLIESLFDPTIVYAKGARLIKMLREYIGDKAFSTGLKTYFKKHAYANTTRHDLWQALEAASGKDIDALMTPWLTQSGLPVLHVKQTGKQIELSQERFTLDPTRDNHRWPIPLLPNAKISDDLLNTTHGQVTASRNDYVLFNQYGSGHYIVHYQNPDHRAAIVAAILEQRLPTEARINLLNDSILLARHGDDSLTSTLDIIAACKQETRDSVWGLIAQTVAYTRLLTEGDANAEEQIKALRINLAADHFKKLGWQDQPNDDPNTKQLRHTMAAFMIGGEDPTAIKEALQLFNEATSLEEIPAELRNTILSAAVRFGSSQVIAHLLQSYPEASAELQQDISGALASTKDPKTAQKVISTALGKNGLSRPQDVMRWFVLLLRNPYCRQVAWQYMEDNWAWFESTVGTSKTFDFFPTYCASVINSEKWAKKYHDFFEPKRSNKTLAHNIKLGYADIEARLAWRQRDEAAIKKWLITNTQ